MIVGATGTGKSGLSLDLAEALARRGRSAEVVNADAMQLYRGMDIGTAKLSHAERRGTPHHMLDVLEPFEDASVAAYQEQARAVIDQLRQQGIVPILVGGSGLYVSSVIYAFEFPGTDPQVRSELERDLEQDGVGALARRLADLDASVARRIGSTNARRIVRALEVAHITGDPARGLLPEEPTLTYPTVIIGLHSPRERLVERLDARVTGMWRDGLVNETRMLLANGLESSATAGRAIGYAQAAAQIRGELSEGEAIAGTQQLTRRYARRQVSWFKRYSGTTWLESESETIVAEAERHVRASFTDL
ncbi:tRNA (adenosine(37)-N6)-dimethylallyltransferase MiaA [Paramicrobacterium agarici]|uniref:tRNA (adenosine(37)-N6)-dimethylallyltransferase MiaA n=1 Tax=Paramicrobacterium agarici TaxID=630514 RepID=UPI001173EEFF|nr:tRNA (adenosine(37)-N6)-dimethylallyltransferase MiaA [Microbacterium agarici]TQO24109.1 tRNA dimethylallyltransferase [Microbacterium agarici]